MSSLVGACAAPAPEEVIQIDYNSTFPPLHPVYYDSHTLLMERIMELSNGRVEITSYPHGALFKIGEYWEALLSGRVDMIDLFPHTLPGQFPLATMFMLPFIGSGSSAITSMAAYELVNTDFPDVFYPQFAGARVMATHVTAVGNLHTRDKMVTSLEDLEGMIIAGENPMQLAAIEAWGATPEHITMSDGFLALERGVIDGGIWPWAPLRSFGLADELHYHTLIDFNYSVDYPVMNEETWNSLPPDIQAIFDEVLGMNWAALTGYTLDHGSAVDIEWMGEKGDEFYTLPAGEKERWVELSSGIEGDWIADMAELGVDAEPLLARMKELVAKYEAEPYPEQDWYGFAGRADSPRRPE